MTTKQERESNSETVSIILSVLFVPFLIFTFMHYKKLKREFPLTETSQRVYDIGSCYQPMLYGGCFMLIGGICVAGFPPLIIPAVYFAYKLAKKIASIYYGVLVDAHRDVVVLPIDGESYDLQDYIQFKPLRDMGDMDSIQLSQINKITRQAGKTLYIHGPFGSRKISFSKKQKRDECIAAIEESSKAVLALEFEDE